MVQEVEDHIEESPASHKKQMQRIIVACVIVVIVLLIAMLMLSAHQKKARAAAAAEKIELEQERKEREAALKGPKESDADKFQKDMETHRQQLLKEIAKAEADGSMPNDPKLKAAIEKIKNSGPQAPATKSQVSGDSSRNDRDPIAEWRMKEKLRALDSNRRPYSLGTRSSGNGMAASQQLPPAPIDLGGDIDTRAPLSEQQRQVREKLAQMKQFKSKLVGVSSDPEAATKLVSAHAESGAHTGQKDIVGFTASKAEDYNESTDGKVLVPTGTVINAVLAQQLISDYPGSFKGTLTHDVYDADYEQILFPKGTTVVGKIVRIRNVNEPISNRMGMAVNWFVLPNGQRVDMSKKAGAQDAAGVGAIGGEVNYHFLAQFLGVAAYAILVSESDQRSSPLTGEVNYEGDIQRSMAEQFSPLVQKYLNLVPTVTLPVGTPFKVFIEDDVYVKPYGTIYQGLLSRN